MIDGILERAQNFADGVALRVQNAADVAGVHISGDMRTVADLAHAAAKLGVEPATFCGPID